LPTAWSSSARHISCAWRGRRRVERWSPCRRTAKECSPTRRRWLAIRPAAAGVFLGYDFHLGPDGPQLIEINSNAGGALLNACLLRAQRACCAPVARMMPAPSPDEAAFSPCSARNGGWPVARLAAAGARRHRRRAPAEQYLAPEFELFRQLFEANGIAALVADPAELSFDGERLCCRGEVVDLVYNRLTDFFSRRAAAPGAARGLSGRRRRPHAASAGACAVRRQAQSGRSSATSAGCRPDRRRRRRPTTAGEQHPAYRGSHPEKRRGLLGQPQAVVLQAGRGFRQQGDVSWRQADAARVRRRSRAAATSRRRSSAPSERRLLIDGVEQDFKLDLRNYVYRGAVQLVSARLYRGQTTNFRTPGGGFAAVFRCPGSAAAEAADEDCSASPATPAPARRR
jgi:hypothetical protein